VKPFPRWARRLLEGGVLFSPFLAVVAWRWTFLGFWEASYLALLLLLVPALALAQLPLAHEEEPLPKVPVYLSSGAVILVLGFLGLVLGWRSVGGEAMGLVRSPWVTTVLWTLILSVAALLVLAHFFVLRRSLGIGESPLLIQLLPKTGREKAVFACLSLAAGVGEELAFRGFLVPTLTLLMGSQWGAAILSSVAFGVLHAYQGWVGVARTAALGLLFAASLLISGTLWPAILAHIILDLLAGLVLGEPLVKE